MTLVPVLSSLSSEHAEGGLDLTALQASGKRCESEESQVEVSGMLNPPVKTMK